MPTNWITGAERLGDGSIGGVMDKPDAPARVVWHTTESGDGDASFKSVADYLIKIGAEPHFLYDPTTDRIGQFGPLNESARALKNDGTTRTNRVGKACIQIEVLARAGKPFTGYWKPGPNFRKLMAAIRSWGVPDKFVMALATEYGDASKRDRAKWLTVGGHYGHCNVPGNDHWDPGAISPAAIFKAAPVGSKPTTPSKPKPSIPPFPGAAYFRTGAKNAYVTQLGKRLIKKGYGRFYQVGAGPTWTAVDRAAVRAFQLAQGWSGSDADGYPGPETWKRLFS
ncbi:peptidoglycan-binding protein [Streptomyces sp. NBC_00885]|uniref:peptidoglycan-binding protein n=1 Tax=Streptomyces sp. NBC_00885 TaxID=2975857 RepID=UPI003870E351|nr:peptidoglycan-binding protein [Streptomyces sp. NBC_00885]